MKSRKEQCEFCGRYGAQKHVEDKGPSGHGGRMTDTRYTCERCETRWRAAAASERSAVQL